MTVAQTVAGPGSWVQRFGPIFDVSAGPVRCSVIPDGTRHPAESLTVGEEWLDWDDPNRGRVGAPGAGLRVEISSDVDVSRVIGWPVPRGHAGRGQGRGRKVLAALVPGRRFARGR